MRLHTPRWRSLLALCFAAGLLWFMAGPWIALVLAALALVLMLVLGDGS